MIIGIIGLILILIGYVGMIYELLKIELENIK